MSAKGTRWCPTPKGGDLFTPCQAISRICGGRGTCVCPWCVDNGWWVCNVCLTRVCRVCFIKNPAYTVVDAKHHVMRCSSH